MKRDVAVESPPEEGGPEISKPPKAAGGFAAVVSTMTHAKRELGFVRTAKTFLAVNQPEGFDCPGCAWPEPHARPMFEFCENGAKALAEEATTKRLEPSIFASRSVTDLAEGSDFALGKLGRITHPMILREGGTHFEPIGWDEAFALVGKALRELRTPNEAAFYTSGRTSNEAAFLYQLFARELGTNNLPDCSNMCHESSGTGLGEAIGVGKGTVTLEDFALADAIFVVGQNPGTNHPRMLSTLEEARKRGAAIVSINPLREVGLDRFRHPQDAGAFFEAGTELATLTIQVRINGDVALFKGIMKAMLEAERREKGSVVDWEFVERRTSGFAEFSAAIERETWEAIETASGVPRETIDKAAAVAIASKRTIVCWAMGLTQHKNGVANVQEVTNFALLGGHVGRPGAGLCPVRGHSNVQGDRTMGIWEKMPDAFLDKLGEEFGFEPPRDHGYDTVAAIHAMEEGHVRVFVAMGGNFLSASPDTRRTAEALAKVELAVSVATKLNRSHLVAGKTSLLLPCLGRTERDVTGEGALQFVTVEDSMGLVHASRGVLDPASPELRSEVAIVCGLAAATFGASASARWAEFASDYDRIRDRIERVVPGFEDFNARVRARYGFSLPNAAREGVFRTDDGKAHFTVHPIPDRGLRDGELLMMTIRSHDQFNTTIYGEDDRYRGIRGGRRIVFMNPKDAAERGLEQGALVDLVSRFDETDRIAERFRVVVYDIPAGDCATYYPEANVLVALDSFADKSRTPASKSVIVRIRRAI